MGVAHAQSLPDDAISADDWRFLRHLVGQAAEGRSIERLLGQLTEHLGVSEIVLVRPDERPPDMHRVVVGALQWGDTRLGDLYAALSSQPESTTVSTTVAARLAFFAPVIVLRVAIDG